MRLALPSPAHGNDHRRTRAQVRQISGRAAQGPHQATPHACGMLSVVFSAALEYALHAESLKPLHHDGRLHRLYDQNDQNDQSPKIPKLHINEAAHVLCELVPHGPIDTQDSPYVA